jgi:hypothetical protein
MVVLFGASWLYLFGADANEILIFLSAVMGLYLIALVCTIVLQCSTVQSRSVGGKD